MANTLRIVKSNTNEFWHIPDGDDAQKFAISDFEVSVDGNLFKIVETDGSKRHNYLVQDITIVDESTSGPVESFTSFIDFYRRLISLKYTPFSNVGSNTNPEGINHNDLNGLNEGNYQHLTTDQLDKLNYLDKTKDIDKPVSSLQASADLQVLNDSKAYTDSKLAADYSNIVYFNSTDPETATIFDTNNPPVTNNDALKNDVTNLYIDTDSGTWVYDSESSTYKTEAVTTGGSNFKLAGTSIDAGNNKDADIERIGAVGVGNATAANHAMRKDQVEADDAATLASANSHTDSGLATKLNTDDYNDRWKGKYTSYALLIAAHPTANAGDYAQVDEGASFDVINYNYDLEDGWIEGGSGSAATNTDMLPEGSSNLYFTTARVLATLLTGISFATGGAIVSTDSVLVAFGKIQKQINDALTAIGLKQDILVSGTNIKTVNGNSLLGSGNILIGSASTTMEQITSATTWSFNHALNNPYPILSIWNSIGEIILPSKVKAVDSNNLNIIFPIAVSGYAIAVGNPFSPTPPSYDSDAQAFISAVGTLDLSTKDAVNQLVLDIKSYGLWSKLFMLNIKAGSTAAEHKWNLKDPRDLDAAYRQTYSGTWVHNALGAKSNGTNAFANTYLNPATLGLTGDVSMGVYITETPTNFGDNYFMGGHSGSNNFFAIQRGTATAITATAYASGATARTVPTGVKGFIAISVIGTAKGSYYATTVLEAVSTIGTGVPNVNIYEGALDLGGFYGGLAFTAGTSFIGRGLTATEILNLRNCILVYETALGRN
jgi:hypothetical protein